MARAWTHPSLGSFQREGSTFSKTLTIPAFKRFRYDTGYSNARRSTGEVRLSFAPWLMNEELAVPTSEMVGLAEKLCADPDRLVNTVAQSLWNEFNGQGPTTGTWWYGGLHSAKKSKLPGTPDDLLSALQLTDINIFTRLWDYMHPIVVLTFHAEFENEHGLCVVTDGERVLGSGYACEPAIAEAYKGGG